jgi:hypothetical protein
MSQGLQGVAVHHGTAGKKEKCFTQFSAYGTMVKCSILHTPQAQDVLTI